VRKETYKIDYFHKPHTPTLPMNLFGKAKKQQASAGPSAKDSIIRLRETLEMLEKRERFLQTKIENEVNLAKANVTKNKRGKLVDLCFGGNSVGLPIPGSFSVDFTKEWKMVEIYLLVTL
jgi:charged multivesicular body protein 4